MLFTARQKDHHCQTLNPRNLVNVDPNFLEKIFLDSARQGLSIDFWLKSFLPQNFGRVFRVFFQKFINFFKDTLLDSFKVILCVENYFLFYKTFRLKNTIAGKVIAPKNFRILFKRGTYPLKKIEGTKFSNINTKNTFYGTLTLTEPNPVSEKF